MSETRPHLTIRKRKKHKGCAKFFRCIINQSAAINKVGGDNADVFRKRGIVGILFPWKLKFLISFWLIVDIYPVSCQHLMIDLFIICKFVYVDKYIKRDLMGNIIWTYFIVHHCI